jgi:(S)-ureidoglycine aminohydrolase
MREPNQLVHSRARVSSRYALFPREGYPSSRLPAWDKTEAFVLAAPALGAQFVQYLLKIDTGGGTRHKADRRIETFFFVRSGEALLNLGDGQPQKLTSGSFALIPPTLNFELQMRSAGELLALRKVYEPADGIEMYKPLVGNESNVPGPAWMNNPHARLQTLIPDELQYDFAMNIFTFDPGFGLPYVETHVMEHGLYFLQGKGVYYLEDRWLEVDTDDFLWMGPYCPQSFYATGPTPAKYIYYKNVNREIPL